MKPPLIIAGFVSNWLTEIFVVTYLVLALLIMIWAPRRHQQVKPSRIIAYGVGLYLTFQWSNWFRNLYLATPERGRLIHSYVNLDMSRISFALQELRILVTMLFVAMLWELFGLAWEATHDGTERDISDDRKRLGAISKQGNRFLRMLLVEAAHRANSEG